MSIWLIIDRRNGDVIAAYLSEVKANEHAARQLHFNILALEVRDA